MKKKVIAIVMMATLLFAGCQESNQTDIPILSDVPKATATVNPTEMPVITEVPIVTNIPVVTEKPEVMENPIATEIPAVTDIPEVTEEPVITEEPNISELPVLTEKPTAEPTESPEAAPTEMPTVTMTVEPTTIPEPTADPIVTVVPTAVPTNTPVPTMTPVPTATVKPIASPTMAPTATPKPTATPRPTATPTPKPTPTTKPVKADASKYLLKDVVREDTDWDAITGEYDYNEKGDKVEYWNYDRFTKDMEGIISSFYSQYKIYELKERPSFAGEPKTVKVKDSELNNRDFMKKGIYVGDSVIIDSYTYEQDGNTSNGKEPIVWKVAYMQILCSANEAGFYFPAFKYFPTGSQLTIQYYLVSEKVLDNLRMDEWDDVRLYSGKSSGEYLYEMDTDFTLDFMKYGSSNVGNGKYRPWIYNTTDFKMAYNQLSLEKGDNISPKITPTKYAMNNGLAVDGSGICERVWLDAERSAPDKDGYILDYAWLSLRKDGKLEFLKQYEEAGFLPELTIWTGVDTTPPREGETLVSESEFGVGNWLWDEDIINKDIWKPYASFVTWDWVIN